jgi:hypothetical protein
MMLSFGDYREGSSLSIPTKLSEKKKGGRAKQKHRNNQTKKLCPNQLSSLNRLKKCIASWELAVS